MVSFLSIEEDDQQQKQQGSVPVDDIHGDVLEEILCHVALVDLIPASHVSRAWNVAVSSSLRNFNQLKPWLIVQTQSSRAPYTTSSRAYDPRSRVWIDIEHSPIEYVSALRSSHSKLLYMFSPSKLSYSTDPFHQKWNHVDAPVFWRTDPIVAVIGNRIVVAGGTCDFEEDPLAVEVYDFETCKWSTCESMPVILKDSAASTWLSIATNNENLIVSEKHTGLTHSFDPVTMKWNGPYNLRPDPKIFYSVIGFSDDRLILIGLIGDVEEVEGVKVWEVDSDLFVCKQIGEMDVKFVKKLKSEAFQLSSIGVCMSGNMAYVFNPLKVEEVFICEFVNGGCRWGTVEKMNVEERNSSERSVLTCAKIGMEELERAMRIDNLKFTVKKY